MWTGLIRRFSAEDNHLCGSKCDGGGGGGRGAGGEADNRAGDGVNGVFAPAGRRGMCASPFRPPPLEPLVLHDGHGSNGAPSPSRILTAAVAEEIRAMVPERLRIADDWHLIYSLEEDGASLATLYQKCRAYESRRAGFVLVVKDQDGGTFGAYLSEHPRPAPSYFGNGECFLWRASTLASLPLPPSADTTHLTRSTTVASSQPHFSSSSSSSSSPSSSSRRSGAQTPVESIRFKAFPYSGLNDGYINCETGFLSVGSGRGHYGLWLDDSLDVGHSAQCDTFGNEPLSDAGEKFRVLGVEIWILGA